MASTVEIIIKARDEATSGVGRINGALETMQKSFVALAAAAVTFKKAFDLGREGAGLNQLTESFNRMNAEVFKTPNLLNDMRAAVKGTVDDATLMAGLMTLTAGVTEDMAQQFASAAPQLLEIAKAAQKLNPSLGDTAFLYESITRGIKRTSPLILDNLGIVVKVGEANEKYAASLGKTVEEMTANEKQAALLNATLEAGGRIIEQVGGNVDSATDAYDRMSVKIKELTNDFKQWLGEGLIPTLDILSGEYGRIITGMIEDSLESGEGLEDYVALAINLQNELKGIDDELLGVSDNLRAGMQETITMMGRAAGSAEEFKQTLIDTLSPNQLNNFITELKEADKTITDFYNLQQKIVAAEPADQLFKNYRNAAEGVEELGEAAGETTEELAKLQGQLDKIDFKNLKDDAEITEETFVRLAIALGGEAAAVEYLQKVLKDAGQASDDYAVSQDQAEEATKANEEAMEAAADAAREYAQALAAIAAAVQSAQFGNIEDLMEAQQQLADSQGEWVSGYKDTTGQIESINEELSKDLTDEESKKWKEVLDEAAEGGAAWLAAYEALEGDMSKSARNAAVAARAALEGEMGEPFTAFTGDLEGIEEAEEAIAQITKAIRDDYANAVLEAMMLTGGFDESVADMAVTLGLMSRQEADLKLAAVAASEAIKELGPAVEEGFGDLGDTAFAFFFDDLVAASMESADAVEAVMERIRRAVSGEDIPVGEWDVDEDSIKRQFLPEFQEGEIESYGAEVGSDLKDAMLTELETLKEDIKGPAGEIGSNMKDAMLPEIQLITDAIAVDMPAQAAANPTEISTNAAAITSELDAILARLGQLSGPWPVQIELQGGGTAPAPNNYTGTPGEADAYGAHGLHMVVPPGYPNDSFIIGATTGEEVHIGQPGGMVSKSPGMMGGGYPAAMAGGFTVNNNYMQIPSWMDNPAATAAVVASNLSKWSRRAR